MNSLQASNIPIQLVGMTTVAGVPPAACRVHLVSRHPSMFKVYVFWVPFARTRPYTWLDMTITKDASQDTFHLGTADAADQSSVQRFGRVKVDNDTMMAHAGNSFSKPGAKCLVLMNGYLRLVPNP